MRRGIEQIVRAPVVGLVCLDQQNSDRHRAQRGRRVVDGRRLGQSIVVREAWGFERRAGQDASGGSRDCFVSQEEPVYAKYWVTS